MCSDAAARGPRPGVAPCSPALAPFGPLLAPFGHFWPLRAFLALCAPFRPLREQRTGVCCSAAAKGPRPGVAPCSPALASFGPLWPLLAPFGPFWPLLAFLAAPSAAWLARPYKLHGRPGAWLKARPKQAVSRPAPRAQQPGANARFSFWALFGPVWPRRAPRAAWLARPCEPHGHSGAWLKARSGFFKSRAPSATARAWPFQKARGYEGAVLQRGHP